jgi:MtN3 and saliva related transmembrane protein
MKFDIIDHNVSITTNVFLVIANIINLLYNIPQVYKTYKCKSTKDFSCVFILFRIIGNLIWIQYAIEVDSLLMLINNLVTVISSAFIGYYKIKELIGEYRHARLDNDMEALDINMDTVADTEADSDVDTRASRGLDSSVP